MVKRTLYFGNPAYLSFRQEQLVMNIPNANGLDNVVGGNTVPVEDIGVVILDHQQITITTSLMEHLLANNVAIITCDSSHHPVGLMLNLCGNNTQTERFYTQIAASVPLKKQLWQQTIIQKIENQASVMKYLGMNIDKLTFLSRSVRSGDTENCEARAAAHYWQSIFANIPNFTRLRDGIPPNNLLNYGYSILRAIMARSLVGSGLLPTLGIHHKNKYNAYCLADDIMEPYRPVVDRVVLNIVSVSSNITHITREMKIQLLSIPSLDVMLDGERRPLMVAVTATTSSLYKCFAGEQKKILYPII